MWLAHALTLSRIPIAVGFGWAFGHTAWAVGLIALAALTDVLDGAIARWMKRHGARGSDIGGWLDPLADKLFVAIVLTVIWSHTGELAVVALIGARDLVVVPLVAMYAARHPAAVRELRADRYGKAATVVQLGALAIVVAAPRWALPAAGVAALAGLVAAGHYIVIAARTATQRRRSDPTVWRGRDTPA